MAATVAVDGAVGAAFDVAVVVPVRDRCQRVLDAVRSIRAQTHAAAEILVVDDGSVDGSGAAVRRHFDDVTVLESGRRGVSHARNLGITRTKAPWIAFLDSDDCWHANKLARQRAALSSAPSTRVVHCDEIWIRDGVRVNPKLKHAKHGGYIYRHCLPLCCISPSAVVIHRSVFDTVGVFDEQMPACEDYDLWLRIAAKFHVHYVDERLLTRYGGHEDQLSSRIQRQDLYRLRALEKMIVGGELDGEERARTLDTFARKLAVYAKGARRRGRDAEAERLSQRFAALQASVAGD